MFKANNYLISIVETKAYLSDAENIFTEDERSKLADFLATNPHFGDVIPGCGGVRKCVGVQKVSVSVVALASSTIFGTSICLCSCWLFTRKARR